MKRVFKVMSNDDSYWKEGTIVTLYEDDGTDCKYYEDEDGEIRCMYDDELEEIKETQEEPTLKKGTVLECVDSANFSFWTKGKHYVVDEIFTDSNKLGIRTDTGSARTMEYIVEHLKHEERQVSLVSLVKLKIVEQPQETKEELYILLGELAVQRKNSKVEYKKQLDNLKREHRKLKSTHNEYMRISQDEIKELLEKLKNM